MMRWIAWGLTGLIVVIFFITFPVSGFYTYLEEKILSQPQVADRVKNIIRLADARTERFAEHQAKLTLTIDGAKLSNPAPNEAFGGALKFGDLVTLSVGVKLNEEWLSFTADFQANKIIAALQAKLAEFVGIKRYYLVVQSFEVWTGDNAGHHQMLVYLYPLRNRPAELPYRKGASDDELSDLLARSILGAATANQDCHKNLCFDELSSSLISLDRTRTGFEALIQGRQHARCLGESEEKCLMQTEQDFQAAIDRDPDNNHAHLGLGLITISRARSLTNQASAYAVGEQLIRGFDHLAKASEGKKYIARLIGSEDWRKLIESSREFEGLGLSKEFIASAQAYRSARKSMIEGNYANVVTLVDSIRNVPKWLVGHLTALKTQARLEIVTDRSQALTILKDFDSTRGSVDESAWAAIFGVGAATWANGDKYWEDRAAEALTIAVQRAPEQISELDAKATRAAALATMGRIPDAEGEAAEIKAAVVNNAEYDDRKYRSMWLSVGWLSSALGRFDDAEEALAKAVRHEPAYLQLIATQKRFRSFVARRPGYENWRRKVLPKG